MKNDLISLNVRIPADLKVRVKTCAKEEGMTLEGLLKRALDAYLRAWERRKK